MGIPSWAHPSQGTVNPSAGSGLAMPQRIERPFLQRTARAGCFVLSQAWTTVVVRVGS